MKSFISMLACLIALVFSGCGHVDTEDALCQAESDLKIGNIELAVNGCAMLTDTVSDVRELTPTQLCRIAIIYAKVSEIADNQDYMASATKCYERAVSLDSQADSLDHYIESLDVEDQSVMRVIREVTHALNSPCCLRDDDHEDIDGCDSLEDLALTNTLDLL